MYDVCLWKRRVWNYVCPLDLLQEVQIAAEQGFPRESQQLAVVMGKGSRSR